MSEEEVNNSVMSPRRGWTIEGLAVAQGKE